MPIVEDSILIDAPQDKLFDLAQDYGLRLEWDPFLRDLKFRGGATEAAVGVRVWVRANTGLTMEVEYITLKPPKVVAMKMIKGPFFFEMFAVSWRFQPEEGGVRTTFRSAYTTRWPRLRPTLDRAISAVFQRDIQKRLRGLKHAAEQTDMLARLPAAPTLCRA